MPGGGFTALFVVALVLATTPPSALAAAAISPLHVDGNRLVDASGAQVVLRGVSRSGTEFACVNEGGFGISLGPLDQGSVDGIKSWHQNTLRLPLNEDCWLGINGVNPAYSGANYRQAIASYVSLLNQNGLYVILDLHWSAPGTTLATHQQTMADLDQRRDVPGRRVPDRRHADLAQRGARDRRDERGRARRRRLCDIPHALASVPADRSGEQPHRRMARLQLQHLQQRELLGRDGPSAHGTGPGARHRDGDGCVRRHVVERAP
ncbi:MAG: hypothetical protein E6I57_00370 [Chloroflexi bacterium]|nr:MAG: hypothetical protein E6I57_00370 [Chloroflexota bacterium]